MAKQRVKITPQKLKRLYYVQHRSALEVAKLLDCSPTTIKNYLDQYGFRVKRQSEIMRGRKLPIQRKIQVVKNLRNLPNNKV